MITTTYKDDGQRILLIGFGGDGTLREIIVGAAGANELIIGSVAAGSGNDFARAYGTFKEVHEIEQGQLVSAHPNDHSDTCDP